MKVSQKLCLKCQERKPIFSFPRDPDDRSRFSDYCFKCHIAYFSLSNKKKRDKPKLNLTNKIKRQVHNSRKRADQYGVVNTLTEDEWEIILLGADGHCFYCKKNVGAWKLVLEHVMPLSRGGSNSAENVVASCGSCNMRKGASSNPPRKLKPELFTR